MTGATRSPRRALCVALAALASVLLLASCGDGRGEDDAAETTDAILRTLTENADAFAYAIGMPGGTLTSSTLGGPLTFNPALANDAYSSGLLSHLFEGLTRTSWLTDEVEPALADSWEHSEDGLTWTFHLRRDVTWHDGEPFTARDVEFTFNRIIYNEQIPTGGRASFVFRYLDANGAWVEEAMAVTAVDDYTVRIVLPTPFAPFTRTMGAEIYPRHILEPHVEDGTFNSV